MLRAREYLLGRAVDGGWSAIISSHDLQEIERLLDFPDEREVLERHARETAERVYGWDAIAERQRELYEELLAIGAARQSTIPPRMACGTLPGRDDGGYLSEYR